MFKYDKVRDAILEACECEETLIGYEEYPDKNTFIVEDNVNFDGKYVFIVEESRVTVKTLEGETKHVFEDNDDFYAFVCCGILDIALTSLTD